jgi:prepilin-type N-terminal cleavage/methylation domain-containing protein
MHRSWSKNMNRNLKIRANNGFTIVELIVVVTVIGLLAAIAVGAHNKVVNQAKVTKSLALVNTLATTKALFVADPKTTPALISTFNDGPNGNFAMIAPYIRVNGVQPKDEADLLAKSAMPSSVKVTLGTVDDSSFQGSNSDQAPTVTGYEL